MLNIFALLSLAQASFAYVIVNSKCATSMNVYDPPLLASGRRINPNFNEKKCLDVRGGVFSDGTPVQIFDCNGSQAQRWFMIAGSTSVHLAGTNFCLDAGSNPADNVALKIWTCFDNLPAQNWFYTDDKRIALEGQGLCVDLTGGDLTNGNAIQIFKCTTGNVNQIWSEALPLKSSSPPEVPQLQVIIG